MSENHIPGDVVDPDSVTESDDEDLKTLLAKRQHAKPNKWTWILIALLAVALGFTAGAFMQKQVSTMTDRTAPSSFPGAPDGDQPSAPSSRADAGTGDPSGAGAGQGFAPRGDLTVGTVESIDGSTMTVATRDGRMVTVEVPEGTSVTSQVEVALSDLPDGASVVVRGDVGDDGSVTATSVSEGAGGFPVGGRAAGPGAN